MHHTRCRPEQGTPLRNGVAGSREADGLISRAITPLTSPGPRYPPGQSQASTLAVDVHPERQSRVGHANLSPDLAAAARGAILHDDGTVPIAPVRGVKREDTHRLVGVVLDRYR